jgi:predicted DNA-binding transcriptional regulator AlpA
VAKAKRGLLSSAATLPTPQGPQPDESRDQTPPRPRGPPARRDVASIPSTTTTPHRRQGDRSSGDNAAAAQPPSVRLLSKSEVIGIVGVSFPTLWAMMRRGAFPRGVIVGGKTKWRSDEVDRWIDSLPIRKLKGDEAVS